MMFVKLAFVLAVVALASGQSIPLRGQTITLGGLGGQLSGLSGQLGGGQAFQLVPVGSAGYSLGAQTVGLSAAAPQYFTLAGAAPTSAQVQLVRPATQSIQFIAAPAPQTVAVAAPAPQTIAVAAPRPAPVVVSAPAPRPAPVVVAAPAPKPVVRLAAPAVEEDYYEPGTPVAPYAFAFDETDEYGMNLKRQESAGDNGIVTGSYSFTTPEGYTRVVNYVSDEKGFRAQVQTNEPGTQTSQPADAEYQSSAPAPAPARR